MSLEKTWTKKVELVQANSLDERHMKELIKNTLDALGPENKFRTDSFRETFRRFDIQFELDLQKADEKNNICAELKNRNPQVIAAFIQDLTGGYIDFSTY